MMTGLVLALVAVLIYAPGIIASVIAHRRGEAVWQQQDRERGER